MVRVSLKSTLADIGARRIWNDVDALEPAAMFARDDTVLAEVSADRHPATVRIWTSSPCIAVTHREAAIPAFACAARTLGERGWLTVLRSSGGTAVPLTRGILNLSMIYEATPAAGTSLESAYQNLCAPLLDTLLECGIRADVGRVDGSFCDGRYNLTVHGRKIAGTAQKWKSGPDGRRTVLSQAMLIVEFSGLAPGIAAINEFYANLGLPQRFDADRCIGLDRLLCATPADAERALMREIRERLLRRCQGLMLF